MFSRRTLPGISLLRPELNKRLFDLRKADPFPTDFDDLVVSTQDLEDVFISDTPLITRFDPLVEFL